MLESKSSKSDISLSRKLIEAKNDNLGRVHGVFHVLRIELGRALLRH